MGDYTEKIARLKISDSSPKSEPKVSFGIIADVQYADEPNGLNFQKTRTRYYRNAKSQLQQAVDHWNSKGNVSFIIQLGDLIDGINNQHMNSNSAMETVLGILGEFKGPVYHLLGNHDLYNFSRSTLLNQLLFENKSDVDLPVDKCACYQVSIIPGYKFIFLDQYTRSMLGYDKSENEHMNAEAFLRKRNRNNDLNSPEGLRGFQKRFLKFNGAVDALQLAWLDEMLSRADAKRDKVIVFGHLPVYRPSSCSMCLCWNYDEVLEIFHKHDCILAYCSGHDHDGGAAIDEKGIQHITFEGVVETRPNDQCFTTVDIYDNEICFVGSGRVPNYTIKL